MATMTETEVTTTTTTQTTHENGDCHDTPLPR